MEQPLASAASSDRADRGTADRRPASSRRRPGRWRRRPGAPHPRPSPGRGAAACPDWRSESSWLRSHSLRGAAPGRSTIHVRVMRVRRSFSVSISTPASVQAGRGGTPLGARQLDRLAGERRGQRHQLVAVRHAWPWGRRRRAPRPTPRSPARSAASATTADQAARRHSAPCQRPEDRQSASRSTPLRSHTSTLRREVVVGHEPRERPLDAARRARSCHRATARTSGRCQAGRAACARRSAASTTRELAGGVVLEQRFVVGRGQQVLVGADRRRDAAVLLDVRAGRHRRRAGAAPRSRPVNAQSSEAPWPTHLQADGVWVEPSRVVQLRGRDGLGRAGRGVADPQLDAASRVCVNAKRALSGEKPIQPIAGFGGSVTFRSAPSAGFFKRQAAIAHGAMQTVGLRVDAHAGDPQHRLRQLGDGRHARRARAPPSPSPTR